MTAREAFQILIMGTHRLGRRWESEELKAEAFRTPTRAYYPDSWVPVLLSQIPGWKKTAVLAAKEYYNTPKTWVSNGCLTFPSVYDLGLFLESKRIRFAPPQSMAFRGQRDFRWTLLPSLARRPEAVSEEITKLISWLSVLFSRLPSLADRSPLEVIAIAQHYGYRTCLLDFTMDPLIAVAFACYGHTQSSDAEFGSVYYVYLSETEQLAPSTDLATGSLIRLGMDDIPRIKKQRGLFMGGFTRSALANLLHIQRYLFRHSEDTHTFIQDTGLTDDELLPNALLSGDESYANPVFFDSGQGCGPSSELGHQVPETYDMDGLLRYRPVVCSGIYRSSRCANLASKEPLEGLLPILR